MNETDRVHGYELVCVCVCVILCVWVCVKFCVCMCVCVCVVLLPFSLTDWFFIRVLWSTSVPFQEKQEKMLFRYFCTFFVQILFFGCQVVSCIKYYWVFVRAWTTHGKYALRYIKFLTALAAVMISCLRFTDGLKLQLLRPSGEKKASSVNSHSVIVQMHDMKHSSIRRMFMLLLLLMLLLL